MKKLLMTFLTAALLTVCLCVPALASGECQHNFGFVDGQVICADCGFVCPHDAGYWCPNGYGTHVCSICNCDDSDCFDDNADGYCDVCGETKPSYILTIDYINEDLEALTVDLVFDVFDTVADSTDISVILPQSLFDDSLLSFFQYYIALSESVTWNGVDCLCGDEFSALSSGYGVVGVAVRYVNGYPFCYFSGYSKPVPVDLVLGIMPSDNLTFADAGFMDEDILEVSEILGVPVSSSDPLSLYFVARQIDESGGLAVYDPGSPSVLPTITALVTSTIEWITAFALCIVSNSLLLIFVVSVLVVLGLYLLKRTIHL